MSVFDRWEIATSLVPAQRYRVRYSFRCFNLSRPDVIERNLRDSGIVMPVRIDLITGSDTVEMRVTRAMSLTEFSDLLQSAVVRADLENRSLIPCTDSRVISIERSVPGSGLVGVGGGFSLGVGTSLVLLAIGGYLFWRFGTK